MRSVTQAILLTLLAVLCVGAEAFAGDVNIHGVVTDNAGKPVRGAIVRVTLSNEKYLSRFTQKDGRYDVSVPAGSYSIAADAFGYGVKRQTKDTSQASDLNFTLTPKVDVTRLSGAEVEQLIPNDDQTRYLKKTCVSCHDLSWVMHHRGFTKEDWEGFLPTMTQGKRQGPRFTSEQLVGISTTLEKYFGPNANYLGPDADPPTLAQIKHPAVADEVLKSTITEYRIPTGFDALAHSIQVDPYNNDNVWFSEIGFMGNKIGYFNARTEQFKEYPMSVPKASPHTMVTGKDGVTWFTVNNGDAGKVISIDRDGKLTPYYMPDSKSGTHTLTMDHNGNLWFSVGGGEILTFDVSTKKFRTYKFPTEFMHAASGASAADDGEEGGGAGTYDVGADSKGNIWADVTGYGVLVKLDPETGATKEYKAPNVPGTIVQVRGLKVDSHDNVWFAVFHGHKLGKFDPKTEKFTLYQPPTAGATPYGITEDLKTGYIWYGDMSGSVVTRFDPKAEKFVEYPLPSYPNGISRFISVNDKSQVWFTEYYNGMIGVIDTTVDAVKQPASR